MSVYLNEDDNIWHARRFVPETASLRLAAQFRHSLPDADPSAPIPLLENVFEQLNVGGDLVPAEPWTLRYRLARNRSLSVGDVVVVDGSAYAVARFSWDPVTPDQLRAGAERFAIANPRTPGAGAIAGIQLDHLQLIDVTQVWIALNAWLYQEPVAAGDPCVLNLWTTDGSDSDGTFSVYAERWLRPEPNGLLPVDGTQRCIIPAAATNSDTAWALCRAIQTAINTALPGAGTTVGR